EGRAGAVKHRLQAMLGHPRLQPGAVDPVLAVVVEAVLDPLRRQPGAGLLHRVAVGDTVARDGQGAPPSPMSLAHALPSPPIPNNVPPRPVGIGAARSSSGRQRTANEGAPAMATIQKITPCLWFDGAAEEAANFYVSLFPGSSVDKVL